MFKLKAVQKTKNPRRVIPVVGAQITDNPVSQSTASWIALDVYCQKMSYNLYDFPRKTILVSALTTYHFRLRILKFL